MLDIATAPPAEPARGATRVPARHLALAAIAVTYTLVQLVFTLRVGLGWDESVYVSQVAAGVQPSDFSAPRSRGVPLLVAPVAVFTSAPLAIRAYLSVLSGVALYAAYLPWLKLRQGPAVPLAAGLFAGLWVSLFYGNEAMPNLYVALAAVAGTGLFCLVSRGRGTGAGVGVVVAYALASLVRPFDALWVAAPLLVGGVMVRDWRRWSKLGAVAGGLAIGWGAWLVEAVMHYGGPIARLRQAGADNSAGLHMTLTEHLRALDGPLLCRYGVACGDYPMAHIAWFAAIPVLAAVGLRAGRQAPLVLAASCGAMAAAGYLFTVGYAAPRFLMPAYALLAVPVAVGLCRLWVQVRPLGAGVVACAVAAFLVLQGVTLQRQLAVSAPARAVNPAVAAALTNAGLHTPCLLYGHHAVEVGYLTRCSSKGVVSKYGGAHPPKVITAAMRQGSWIGVITQLKHLPAPYLRSWLKIPLPLPGNTRWYLYRPPPAK
jgi:hypothetical protein